MPGIIGVFNKKNEGNSCIELKNEFNKYNNRNIIVLSNEEQFLGFQERKHGPLVGDSFTQSNKTYLLYGHCYDSRSKAKLNAKMLSNIWEKEKELGLQFLEGAFHVVIYNDETKTITLFNDRVGIVPFYWKKGKEHFSFAPRIRLLTRKEITKEPNLGAIINFLSVGHFLGPSTQLKNVNLLTPATILTINTTDLSVTEKRYWNLVYEPDEHSSKNELVKKLGNAIQDSVELFNDREDGKSGIFLSGGWDSRAILGAMLKMDLPPELVVTNGNSDETPYTDTWLAKKMATKLDLPYRFCKREANAGVEKWLDGIHRGEITTANNPESFGLHQLSPDVFKEIDYIMKGDVTWGSGDLAPTRELSIGKVVPYPLMEKVKNILNRDVAEQADELYEEQIDGVMRHCKNKDWTQRRDYLWQMGGINRYILGLGISDEEHIQVRRPLLTGMVFKEYTKVPQKYRILKNLFIETLKTNYPKVFNFGRNHVSNISYYYAYMAEFVRNRTLEYLESGYDLNGLLNIENCKKVINSFYPVEEPVWMPGIKYRFFNYFHDRYSYHFHRSKFYSEKNVKKFETSDTMLAFHIYLLLEWFYGKRNNN